MSVDYHSYCQFLIVRTCVPDYYLWAIVLSVNGGVFSLPGMKDSLLSGLVELHLKLKIRNISEINFGGNLQRSRNSPIIRIERPFRSAYPSDRHSLLVLRSSITIIITRKATQGAFHAKFMNDRRPADPMPVFREFRQLHLSVHLFDKVPNCTRIWRWISGLMPRNSSVRPGARQTWQSILNSTQRYSSLHSFVPRSPFQKLSTIPRDFATSGSFGDHKSDSWLFESF